MLHHLMLMPSWSVLANAGTPLMWAGFCHLSVGNLVIGLMEAAVIVWLLHHRRLAFVTKGCGPIVLLN